MSNGKKVHRRSGPRAQKFVEPTKRDHFRKYMGPGESKILGRKIKNGQIEAFTEEESSTLSERIWAISTREEWEASIQMPFRHAARKDDLDAICDDVVTVRRASGDISKQKQQKTEGNN